VGDVIWPGVGCGRLLRPDGPWSGVQQVSPTVERMTQRAALAAPPATHTYPSLTVERVESCDFIFSSRKQGKVCWPSRAISRAAGFHGSWVLGPPPAPSGRRRLRRIISRATPSNRQSTPKDFNSGAWPRRLRRRPEANFQARSIGDPAPVNNRQKSKCAGTTSRHRFPA
jgi:hypothetical protein